ncbi:MAG: hypothetical protein WA823_11550 [Candidatus Acidiferrales bacterium]
MIRRYLALPGLLLLASALPAFGCTCSKLPPGTCPGLQADDVVFTGTVIDIEVLKPAASGTPDAGADTSGTQGGGAQDAATPITRYRFRVDERFAGAGEATIDIFSGGDDGDCGYNFKLGDQYIVFTQQETEGRLFATICNGTRPSSQGRALVPQLRAMKTHEHVASVFGVLRRADPPLLAPSDDPEDPLPNIKLKLRSKDDRFSSSTGPDGVYTFYDVHAGEYSYTADLPARFEFTQKTLKGGLPPFRIPSGACYEYNVDALPTGKIRGAVLGPDGKPLKIASVELYRSDKYDNDKPGLWGFQGSANPGAKESGFEFDHIGAGDYLLVFNRTDRKDPNSPYARTFYPGAPDPADAKVIHLKDGEQLLHANVKLGEAYPTRKVKVALKWQDGRPPGDVTVMGKAEDGGNPSAQKIGEGLYEFTILENAKYTFSAWEDLDPQHTSQKHGEQSCTVPARIDAAAATIDGADESANEVTLFFVMPPCNAAPAQDQPSQDQPQQ